MKSNLFGRSRVRALIAAAACAGRVASAQVAPTDSTAPELRLKVIGSELMRGQLMRATRDTLHLRVSDLPFAVARSNIARLELRGPTIDANEASERAALGVLKAGLITTGVLGTLGSLPCLRRDARSEFFPCYTLGALAAIVGIPTTVVLAVVVGAATSLPQDTWLPVSPTTWRVSVGLPSQTAPSVARPVLGVRVTF
jgi:hypothetical protein